MAHQGHSRQATGQLGTFEQAEESMIWFLWSSQPLVDADYESSKERE
jgi:hypothetical protein